MNIVASFVQPDMVGDGRDDRGEHESGAFGRAIDASKLVCARLASETPAPTSSVATRLLELHHRVVHEILNVAPPTQDQRGTLAAEWIPRAQQWDRDVVQAMRELGCKPDEVHYVETFPLPSTNRRDRFIWEMNCQWTISDIRRERLEKVVDRHLDRPIFTA